MTHPLSEAVTSVEVKLEPCRRCGQRDAEVFANDGWFTVECNNCPCRTSGADRSAAEAIEAWNRRALTQPTPAETEGAKYIWLELREPGRVPERKGPFRAERTAEVLREFFAARPAAYVSVVTVDENGVPLFQDGPECLQMLDGRSMSTGRKHIKSSAEAHAKSPTPLPIGDAETPSHSGTVEDERPSDGLLRGAREVFARGLRHLSRTALEGSKEVEDFYAMGDAMTCNEGDVHNVNIFAHVAVAAIDELLTLRSRQVEAGELVPVAWRCAKCGCHTYARVDRLSDGGKTAFEPGDDVRCVSCKDVSFYPVPASALTASQARVEALTAALEAADDARTRLNNYADAANAGEAQAGGRELKRKIWGAFSDYDRARSALKGEA